MARTLKGRILMGITVKNLWVANILPEPSFIINLFGSENYS